MIALQTPLSSDRLYCFCKLEIDEIFTHCLCCADNESEQQEEQNGIVRKLTSLSENRFMFV